MSEESTSRRRNRDGGPELPFHWQQVHSAIWMIGLAILFWQGWWWPGILVLVALSGLAQALIHWQVKRAEDTRQQIQQRQQIQETRAAKLPENCPNCGAPLNAAAVTWISNNTATCPYCMAAVKALDGAPDGATR